MIDQKQKAINLYSKFHEPIFQNSALNINGVIECKAKAKHCAIVCVEEIIKASPSLPILGDSGTFGEDIELSKSYWQEVLNELNNL